jgi:glycogen debranching enzyme
MSRKTFLLFFILYIVTLPITAQSLRVGNFYGKIQNGLTFIINDERAINLRFGWYENGKYENAYDDLVDETYYKGAHAPDQRYVVSYWLSAGRKVTLEWGKNGNHVYGSFKCSEPIELVVEAIPAWQGYSSDYQMATTKQSTHISIDDGLSINFSAQQEAISSATDEKTLSLKLQQRAYVKVETAAALASVFKLEPAKPLYFSTRELNEEQIKRLLLEGQKQYTEERLTASGDWGNFAYPILNNIQHSRAYNFKHNSVATIVSHKWTLMGGQRLFEWDTFFNGLLASLEDPEAAREDFRGMLRYQQENGMVPNVASPVGEISTDRSQPPVGSLCLWKYYQHTGDTAFIAEVFPALLRWNRWWFAINQDTGLPYRDGNRNGLLEWGTSDTSILDLSKLQLAKYESGQDNSPMFDNVVFNPESNTIEMDMVGLSSLWAMDTYYLAKMATLLHKPGLAKTLKEDVAKIGENINTHLWDEEQNRYADRYWDGKSKKPIQALSQPIPESWFTVPAGKKGILQSIYKEDKLISEEIVNKIDITPRNGERIEWVGSLSVNEDDEYFFYSPDENGVLLFIDGVKLFDNRRSWITEFTSEGVFLKKGHIYDFKLVYDGEKNFNLRQSRSSLNTNVEVFSETFSINTFYPLIVGLADESRGEIMLSHLTDTTQFWGNYIAPVVSRQDPAFPKQGYWRGRIWPPTNYLLYQGVRNYATPEIRAEFAEKSVDLFMRHWNDNFLCYENWYADGRGAGFPHYSWGLLNLLIGLEECVKIDTEGNTSINRQLGHKIEISNYPVRGVKTNFQTQ